MNQKILVKHIPCECRSKFDGRKYYSKQKLKNDNGHCEFKKPIKHHECKEDSS